MNRVSAARWVITLIPIVLLFWVVNHHVSLLPSQTIHYRIGSEAPPGLTPGSYDEFIARYSPVDKRLHWYPSGDANVFLVQIPRYVESVRFRTSFPIFTRSLLMLSMDTREVANETHILRYDALNNLNWDRTTSDDLTFWQRPVRIVEEAKPVLGSRRNRTSSDTSVSETIRREVPVPKYSNWNELFANAPEPSRIGFLGMNPYAAVHIPNYQPSPEPIRITHRFRGSHTLYLYAGQGENVNLAFDKTDLNRVAGKDPLRLTVADTLDIRMDRSYTLASTTIKDDGNTLTDGNLGEPQRLSLRFRAPREGMYQIFIRTSEDVVFENIASSSQYLAFGDRIFFADGPAYVAGSPFTPVRVTGWSNTLEVEAAHEQGQQTFLVNKKKYNTSNVKRGVLIDQLGEAFEADFTRGDFSLVASGLLRVDAMEPFPNRGATVILPTIDPQLDKVDYLLAPYVPSAQTASQEVDWKIPLRELRFGEDRTVKFTLTMPTAGVDGSEIDSASVQFTRKPITWKNFKRGIQQFF